MVISQPKILRYIISNHIQIEQNKLPKDKWIIKDNVVTRGNVVKKPYHKGKNRESTLLGPPAFLTKVLNYMTVDNITSKPKNKDKSLGSSYWSLMRTPHYYP